MKKPKLSLGPDGIKGLFVQHVEKIVFGVAILLVLVFIFLGYRLESKLSGKTPDKLRELATTAVANIERPTFEEVKKERMPREGKGGQYDVRLGVASVQTTPGPYELVVPLDPPKGKPGSKREDPQLFAPIKLETTALTGALCVRSEDPSLLADLDNAPAEQERKKRVKKRRSRGGYGMGPGYGSADSDMGMYSGDSRSGPPGMSSDYGSEMSSDSYYGTGSPYGPGTGSTRRDNKKKEEKKPGPARRMPANKVCGYRPAGVTSGSGYGSMGDGGMPGMSMPGMSMPGMSMPGMSMPGMSMPGMSMPGMSMPGGGSGSVYGTGRGRDLGAPAAESRHLIAVKALVPYRKQVDEFKRVLGDAIGYDPNRDNPRVVFFEAQRADVTDDPSKEPAEEAWQAIMNPKAAARMAERDKWYGMMQEVADLAYVDRSITMSTPPMMLRCMDEVMLHSEVPRSTVMPTLRTAPETEADAEKEKPEDKSPDTDMPGGAGVAGGFPGRGGYPGMGGSGYPGMSGSGYPGMSGSGYPGMSGSGYPGMSGSGYPGMSGGGYSDTDQESDMGGYSGMGGAGYPGMGGMGYGMSGSSYSARLEPPQYKLIRFYDMDVEPGRVYRYRIRLFVEDPNNPNTNPVNGYVSVPPRRRTLSMKVIDRLNKQQADPKEKDVYYMITDWSAATEPVSLPSPSRAYVADVSPARMSTGSDGSQIQQSEVSGSVVPVVWHDSLAIDVSKEMKAFRGSVLNMKGQFDVLDPITLVIKLIKDFAFDNRIMVVDMRGGEDLPGDRENRVTSFGEFALLDDQGNFVVHNELDDYEKFERFTFEDEIKLNTGGGYGSMMGTGADYGGYPGMDTGPPGGSGGGSRRGSRDRR